MTQLKPARRLAGGALIGAATLMFVTGGLLAGCGQDKPVDTSTGQFGKAGSETTLPPQGAPPPPGADMSKRGAPQGRK